MAVLSARFAVLACLCAVIPLTPSVEAAHIYGGHLMEKHTFSAHSPQRSHDRTFSGGSTTGHSHHDKNHGHQTHDHRAAELPPLLRRYHVHDHKKDHHHQDHRHESAHDKVPRSAFARSRYRREPSRRSSIYVPGEHGNTYLVSRTPPRNWGHGYVDADKEFSHAYTRRQVDESNLAFGRIDIMSAQLSGGTQRLASLTVDSTPIDWTSGQISAKAFPLTASTANQTQFIMMPTDDSNVGGSNKHVTLATEVFDASSAEMVMYCATYDPDPGQASALLMAPCTGITQSVSPADDATDPCASGADDASSSNSHQSQIFSYDPSSGKIEPLSTTGNATWVGSNANTSTSCVGAKVRRDTGNSTTGSSVRPSSTSTSITPTASAFQQAQNVTLVYVAGALEVPAASPSPSAVTTTTTGASIGQVAVFTTTVTTTVVATVTTASGTPIHSGTPARAAASVSTSTPSPPATPSDSTTTTQSSLSPSGTASTTLAPAKADESLEVQVVAVTPSMTGGVSTTTDATTMATTTTSYSSGSASPTLDAAAVASLVANQMPHRRRAVIIAGASVTPVV